MNMKISIPALGEDGFLPAKYTCDGENISPLIEWEGTPEKAEFLVLICDDPDAYGGTWVHWIVFNIPADTKGLPENVLPERELKNSALQGMNDFKKIGYGGPCPPSGEHRYFFKLYALDDRLNLLSGAYKNQILIAMESHVLAQCNIMCKYSR
jgi:Raf kinase inhibitor-like YbhB/YbcL family protein